MTVHAYVGYRPCGHPVALTVDDGEDSRDTAKFVAQIIADGGTVERVTLEHARQIGVVYCYCVLTLAADGVRRRQLRRESAHKRRWR